MIAGIFSSFGNQPFDVLKTRMQGVRADEKYSSTWDCIRKTFKRDGIPGFCEYFVSIVVSGVLSYPKRPHSSCTFLSQILE